MKHGPIHAAPADVVRVPRGVVAIEEGLEFVEVLVAKRVRATQRHHQPVGDDRESLGKGRQALGRSTAAMHVVLGRDLEERDLAVGVTTHDVAEEGAAKTKADTGGGLGLHA